MNGKLDLSGSSQSINGLSGIGVVDSNAAGTPTLTVGNNSANSTYLGVIQNSSGTLSINKTGAGTLTLNNNNTYSGATNITGGTLKLALTPSSVVPLANLKTWFDPAAADTVVTSAGKVTQLVNRAGGDVAAQATVASQPTLNTSNAAFNGLPTLTFSGAQYLSGFNAAYLNGSAYTIFTVSAVNAAGNQYMLGTNHSGTDNQGLHFGYRTTNDFTLAQYANDLDYTTAVGYNGTSEVAMDWAGKLDTTSGHALYFNGGSAVKTTPSTVGFNAQTSTDGILGAGYAFNNPFHGDIGEVLIFNSALSDAQRLAVDSYLQNKWGIAAASSWTSNVLPSNTPVAISGGGTLDLNGGNQSIGSLASSDPSTQVLLGAGTLTTGGDGTSTTFAGMISGSGGLTKLSGGALTLSGASTYSGSTTINGGTLRAANATGSATGSGAVTINAGTLSSGPVGTISGSVSAGSGASAIAPGDIGAIGTLTLGSTLTLNGSSTLHFDINGLTSDLLAITGAISMSGGGTSNLSFDSIAGLVAGHTYTLATFASSSLTNASFVFSGVPSGFHVQVDPTDIQLITSNGSAQWNANGTGDGFYGTATNWSPNSLPSGQGIVATFGNGASNQITPGPAAVTVKVNGNFTVGSLAFGNTNGTQFILANDSATSSPSITLDNGGVGGGASIVVGSGVTATQQIFANIVLNDNLKFNVASGTTLEFGNTGTFSEMGSSRSVSLVGGGTVQIDSAAAYTGTTTIHGGTLRTSGSGSIGNNTGAAVLDATGGASFSSTLNIGGTQTLSSLTTATDMAGGVATLKLSTGGALTVGGASTFTGTTNFQANSTLNVAGTLHVTAGATSVGTGVTATVAAGATLELDGSISSLTDAAALSSGTVTNSLLRAAVKNDGTLQVDVNAIQQVGGIDPNTGTTGGVVLSSGASLTADHINQTSLVIGNGATFTLAPSDSNGNPMASTMATLSPGPAAPGSAAIGSSGLILAGSLAPTSSFLASSASLLGTSSATAAPAVSLNSAVASVSPVPEPSAIVLLLIGGASLLLTLRRKVGSR